MTRQFEEAIKTMSEVELFFTARLLGLLIWRTDHDAADGRIKDGPFIDRAINEMHGELKLIRNQLKERFDLKVYADDKGNLSPEYMNWYDSWNNYLNGMAPAEYAALEAWINAGRDTSDVKLPR